MMHLAVGGPVRSHVQLQCSSSSSWYSCRSTAAARTFSWQKQTPKQQQTEAARAQACRAHALTCSCCHGSRMAPTTRPFVNSCSNTAAIYCGLHQRKQQAIGSTQVAGSRCRQCRMLHCQCLPADNNDNSSCTTTTTSSSSSNNNSSSMQPAVSAAALAAAEAIAAAAEAEAAAQAAAIAELHTAATPQLSLLEQQQQQQQHGSPTQQRTWQMKQPQQASVAPSAAAGAGDEEMEQAWLEAAQAVSRQLGQSATDLCQQLQLLRLLLPDLDATLAARRAAAQQWVAVAEQLRSSMPLAGAAGYAAAGYAAAAAAGSSGWVTQEMAIMDKVQEAIRCCERDGADAVLHNSLMMAIADYFAAVRCYGQHDPGTMQQQQALLQQIEQCARLQQQKASQMMQQQVTMAASCDQLPEKLITLKSCISSANVSQLVVRHPALLQHPPQQLEQMVLEVEAALSSQLSSEEVALMLETEPWLLEPGALAGCIGGLTELLPAKEPCRLLLQHVVTGGSKLLQEYKCQALA